MHHWGPFFEEDGKNASEGGQLALEVPLGGSVHLNCRVGMLHDKTVSTGAISNILSGDKGALHEATPQYLTDIINRGERRCYVIRRMERNRIVLRLDYNINIWGVSFEIEQCFIQFKQFSSRYIKTSQILETRVQFRLNMYGQMLSQILKNKIHSRVTYLYCVL